jgi:hypothetical protein
VVFSPFFLRFFSPLPHVPAGSFAPPLLLVADPRGLHRRPPPPPPPASTRSTASLLPCDSSPPPTKPHPTPTIAAIPLRSRLLVPHFFLYSRSPALARQSILSLPPRLLARRRLSLLGFRYQLLVLPHLHMYPLDPVFYFSSPPSCAPFSLGPHYIIHTPLRRRALSPASPLHRRLNKRFSPSHICLLVGSFGCFLFHVQPISS